MTLPRWFTPLVSLGIFICLVTNQQRCEADFYLHNAEHEAAVVGLWLFAMWGYAVTPQHRE